MSKKIKVFRNFTFSQMSQEDPEVKAWFNGSFMAVGPYYSGKVPGSGLSFQEQRLLLPYILSVEANDKDFRKKVENHYHEVITKIPADGVELEIGLEDDSRPLSEDNLPLNIKDYVSYRHIKHSPEVAENKDTAERYGHLKKYYIEDTDAVTVENVAISDLEDRAFALYIGTKDDQLKVDQILTMLGVVVRDLNASEKQLKFKSMATKQVHMNVTDQKNSFQKFIDLCQDKDLSIKFLIQELVGAQVLEKVGRRILLRETGQELGEDMKDAVMFLNSPKNSKILNVLKAEYQAKVKKDASLAPETIKD